jgi:hypothetical protein
VRPPVALWPVALAAVVAGLVLLFDGEAEVTASDVISRSVGGSFIACGLIAWQRRPESRIGALMTLTGFVYLTGQLLSDIDRPVAYTAASWSRRGGTSRSPRWCSGSRAAGSPGGSTG